MTKNNETNSTSKKGAGHADFKFCCGDSEEMTRIMLKFCNSEDGTSDFRAMMQKMCCTTSEKSEQS